MKAFVAKAVSSCERTAQPRLARRLSNGSQHRVFTTAATNAAKFARRASTSSISPKFVEYSKSSNIINEVKSFSEVCVEALPREITWLAGAPGAGKGTNSKFISEICGYSAPTIVVSSLLEQPEFKHIKDAGGIVDDAVVFKVLSQELAKPKYRNGVVVDGFPRTQQQAEWLASLYQKVSAKGSSIKFNFVMLYVNEEVSISRQLARGAAVRAQNSVIRNAGGLPLLEERATDLCGNSAKVRYQGFIDKYEAISQTLGAHEFPCYIVDASSTVEAVQEELVSCLAKPEIKTDHFQHKNWHDQFVSFLNTHHLSSGSAHHGQMVFAH